MNKFKTIFLILLSLVVIYIATVIGIASIPITVANKILISKLFFLPLDETIGSGPTNIIFNIRLPRVMLAFLTGSALSVCGASYQGIFKNSMADPYILGVSSGAAFGASIGIILNISETLFGLNLTTILAFIGSFVTITLVYSVSKVGNKVPVGNLLLSGIAFSQTITAFMSLLMIFNLESLTQITFWTLGSFNGKGWFQILTILPYLLIGLIILFTMMKDLDIMLLGEETANNLGVNVEGLKKKVLFSSSLVTASVVSVSGIIGFVGLIVPHVCRIILGPKHRDILPASLLVGGILLVSCDTIARSVSTQEIPVGIITAILGGPFFINLLRKNKR